MMMMPFRSSLQKVSRTWLTLRGYYAGLVLLRDPSRLDMVFEIDRAVPPEEREALVARVRKEEVGRSAIADRARLTVDVAELAALPEGTFGRAVADFLRQNELDPRAIPTLESPDDGAYVDAHLYETHDVWHVATGFEADIAGELGLQAFYLAQLGGKLPPILLGGGLLHGAMRDPGDLERRMESVTRGWNLGRRAHALFGVRWDRLWTKPLAEVRAELGLAR